MRAVHVGIGHDDDLVVAQFLDVELIAPDTGAKRGDQRADGFRRQHPVKTRPFDVQDLATQRQHGLLFARPALLGRTTGAVTLDDEKFRKGGVFFLTIRQLAGQRGHVHRRLAAGQFACLAGGFARKGGLNDLAHNDLGFRRMFLEPFRQLFVHQILDRRAHLGGDKLVLGLAREFGVRHLHRQHAGQAFPGVIAGEIDLFLLRNPRRLGIAVDRARQCPAEACKVGAAIALRDVVGEGQHRFMVAVVPPHRDLNPDAAHLARHVDRIGHHRLLRPIKVFHEFLDAALIEQLGLLGFGVALILDDDADARIQEGQFPQAGFERLEAVLEVRKCPVLTVGLGAGEEPHLGAALTGGRANLMDMGDTFAKFEPRAIFGIVAPDRQLQPFRQRVDDRNPHAVQTARHLVGIAAVIGIVEFPARVQLGHDDLGRRNALFGVDIDRDAAAIVTHRNAVIGVDLHVNVIGMTGQGLVNAVVHDLIDHVMQAAAVVGIPDIHAGALADSLQPFENLDRIGAVFLRLLRGFGHVSCIPRIAREL